MILKISEISNVGNLARERVILRAIGAGDLGNYAIFCGYADEDGDFQAGSVANAFWFPTRDLKTGDIVVLYTKDGSHSEKLNDSKTTSHFFYWGLTESLWDKGRALALVNTSDWKFFKKK